MSKQRVKSNEQRVKGFFTFNSLLTVRPRKGIAHCSNKQLLRVNAL